MLFGAYLAQIDAKSKKGLTPLMAAAKGGNLEIVRFLLERGADVNARNEYGKTALRLAALDHRDDVVDYLQQCGGTT